MDFELDDLQRMLRESARGYVAARRAPGRASTAAEEWATMAQLGWLGLQLPEELDGADGGPNEIVVLMEALGEALTTVPFLSTAVIGARAIARHAEAARRRALLPRLRDGSLRVAFAHAESGGGLWDVSPGTRAARAGGGFRLSGEKAYVLDGPGADMFIVSARCEGRGDGAIELFLVDAGAPGVERRDFSRLDGGGASHVGLREVEVAPEDRLGEAGAGASVLTDLVDVATVAVSAEAVGVMQALHDRTLEYLKVRRQFGRQLGDFQVLQHRQVDMLIAVEQARSIVMAAGMALAEADPAARRLISMAKVIVGRAGRFVAQSAVQSHGGIGMTAELPVGAYFKRMMVIDRTLGAGADHLRALAGASPAPAVSFVTQGSSK